MFLEIRLRVPPEWSETVAALLVEQGCRGTCEALPLIREGGPREITAFADALHGPPSDLLPRIEAALQHLAEAAGEPSLAGPITWRLVPDQPWEDLWKSRWRPFRVAGFLIRPPWRDATPRPTDIEVALDPGSAFGTGLHVTTRQALRGLRRRLASPGPPPSEVCDAGTGSGILAIAALLAGVPRATAFDHDQRATLIAARNAKAAGVAARLSLFCGTPASLGASFPLVLANLETDIHRANAPALAALTAPGGTLVATGVQHSRARQVLAAYASLGLTGRLVEIRGKWASLALSRT